MPFSRKFYVADTHFCHANILSMQPRNFDSISDHDETLIALWNSVVGDKDIVYHLGDFALGVHKHADRVRQIFSRLNGRKYLIVGNHDVDRNGDIDPIIASLSWEKPPTGFRFTDDDGHRVVMSHYAQRAWQRHFSRSVHFFGHSHGNLPGEGLSRDVGVDLPDVDYTPRTFKELTKGWVF